MPICTMFLAAACSVLFVACSATQESNPAPPEATSDSISKSQRAEIRRTDPKPDLREYAPMFLELMGPYYLLEVGRTYQAKVNVQWGGKDVNWTVVNPPIPRHFAVGFQWTNLKGFKNLRQGSWTFLVRKIDRRHSKTVGSVMGTFHARYICELIHIEDADNK